MRITILIDNNENPDCLNLHTEHGLSIYFELDNKNWLLDCGASSHFSTNAKTLGIDLSKVEHLILSHSHNDHTGGLSTFLEVNKSADIFISNNVIDNRYFSRRRVEPREIGYRFETLKLAYSRVNFITCDTKVANNVEVLAHIESIYPQPKANKTLYKNQQLDDFNHEIVVVATTQKGIIVLSSCSHKGILNTLETVSTRYPSEKIVAYIGGAHLPNGEFETADEIQEIGKQILERYPNLHLYTGHCTESNALKRLCDTMGKRFTQFYSGFTIEL